MNIKDVKVKEFNNIGKIEYKRFLQDTPYEDLSYDEARKVCFNFLNKNNVSESTINKIMSYYLFWAQLLMDKETQKFIQKNRPDTQPKKAPLWELGLTQLIDSD